MKKKIRVVCLALCCFIFLVACSSDGRTEFIETSNEITEAFNSKIQDSQDKATFDKRIEETTELIDKLEEVKVANEYSDQVKLIVAKDREVISSIKKLYSLRNKKDVKEYNTEIENCNKLLNELNKLQEEFLE